MEPPHPPFHPQEKLAYHRRSRKLLAPGLYLGYLKLCTSVEQMRALVPQKLPNVLCHAKIRDNHNVSRLGFGAPSRGAVGAWDLLKSFGFLVRSLALLPGALLNELQLEG